MSAQTVIVVVVVAVAFALRSMGTRPGVAAPPVLMAVARALGGGAAPGARGKLAATTRARRRKDGRRMQRLRGERADPRRAKRAAQLTAPAYLAAQLTETLPPGFPRRCAPHAADHFLRAELAFGTQPLLDRAEFSVDPGERIGLIGRNGTGKSCLLGAILGRIAARRWRDAAARGLAHRRRRAGARASRRRDACAKPPPRASVSMRSRTSAHAGGPKRAWSSICTDSASMAPLRPSALSGGERKRAALAAAIALDPQLLLLDEPTNHLDIEGIEQLETLLLDGPAVIVVTHDRAFLDRVATRIVELDRGLLRSYPGNFSAYEHRKAGQLADEAVARRKFDKFWAQEEVWIRKGIEARRTRNEGRVKRLEQLRRDREARRERLGNVKLAVDTGERSGKLVAELQGVGKSYGERHVVRDLDLRILRGDRFGLIGPNGAGKSTLLKLILGKLEPDRGTVKLGTQLSVAYFDQLRAQLDPELTVAATISPNSDWVGEGEQRRHVISYLGDFLFPPQRAESPVRMLSGGERNRLLLAHLFARPANILVLDEPTNDLDIESLELLEQTLQGYRGTLLLVSHDRTFLDNVVTQTLAPEGEVAGKSMSAVIRTGCSSVLSRHPRHQDQYPPPGHPTAPRRRRRARRLPRSSLIKKRAI